jgi:hypothetical protein
MLFTVLTSFSYSYSSGAASFPASVHDPQQKHPIGATTVRIPWENPF